ncbi:MAG: ketoacyl-ACP synthase III [Deltaproteobacteria bacterium]|nr:ketoacyl-ACP synthase III [Deltaproteobacteria bacterium]
MKEDIYITAMGHQYPEHELDNEFFEQLDIGSSASWVEERTGIQRRHSVLSRDQIQNLRYAQTSVDAMRKNGDVPSASSIVDASWDMLKDRDGCNNIRPDIVICGTSVPDDYIPAQASLIADKLKLTGACFDVNSACSSFVTNLSVATAMLKSGVGTSAAIFNVERYTLCLDYTDRKSCVLFGDGAAASLLRRGQRGIRGFRILDTMIRSDPTGSALVRIPVAGLFSQQGARVQKFAVSKTCEVSEEMLQKHALSVSDLDYFIGHQANLRMLTSACQKLGIPDSRHLFNVDKRGNQGAAGAPAVLSSNWHRFRDGELLLVAVVGSGLTWGAALLEYCQGSAL